MSDAQLVAQNIFCTCFEPKANSLCPSSLKEASICVFKVQNTFKIFDNSASRFKAGSSVVLLFALIFKSFKYSLCPVIGLIKQFSYLLGNVIAFACNFFPLTFLDPKLEGAAFTRQYSGTWNLDLTM